MIDVGYHVNIWQVLLSQLICGHACQIWKCVKESKMYFSVENFISLTNGAFTPPPPFYLNGFTFIPCPYISAIRTTKKIWLLIVVTTYKIYRFVKLTSSCLIDESISIHMINLPVLFTFASPLPAVQWYSPKVLGRYQITAQHYQHYLIAIDGSSSDTNGQPKDVNMLQTPFRFNHVSSESAALYSLLGKTMDYIWYAYLIKNEKQTSSCIFCQ